MNVLFTCLVSLLFCIIPIFSIIRKFVKSRNNELNKNNSSKLSFFKENIFSFLAIVVLFFGCFIRLICIDKYPVGLNQDEASSAYEAWSILNFEIDRNGQSFPIQFISWGSGQNVLYSYLMIPFISILGLNTLSIRLPMVLIGCISLVVFYYFMKFAFRDKKSVLFLFLFAIFPWHFMKSRWGLESNIFPDLILWAIFAIYIGIKKKSNCVIILSGIIFGLSTYSYGTSYFFVPVLLALIYILLFITKKLSIKQLVIHLSTTTLISLPMILFVIVNYFDLNTLKIGPITIPKLPTVRFKEITAVGSGLESNIFSNFINNIKMLLTNDGNVLNYTIPYGLFFCNWLTIPLIIIGIIVSMHKQISFCKLRTDSDLQGSKKSQATQKQQDYQKLQSSPKVRSSTCILTYTFINCFFVASLLLMFMVDGAINRINVIFIPLVFYTAVGILTLGKVWFVPVITYFILFIFMEHYYFTYYQTYISSYMNVGLKEAIIEASNIIENYKGSNDANSSNNNITLDNSEDLQKHKALYIDTSINQPYIFYLLYNKIPTPYYIDNVQKSNEDAMFQTINSIGNVYFTIPTALYFNNVYVFRQSTLEKYKTFYTNLSDFTCKEYSDFVVLYMH